MDGYFEELAVGDAATTGDVSVTAEEIRDFATRYDPQPIHTDPDAAAESHFGGLVASGWHTAALTMRLLVDEFLAASRALGATGVDELRFRAPVRPGDVLAARAEVVDKEPFDEDRGLVHVDVTTRTDEETKLTMVGLVLWERRSAGGD